MAKAAPNDLHRISQRMAVMGSPQGENGKNKKSTPELGWKRMFGQNVVQKLSETSEANPMSFETTAITFFIILLICFLCILLLLGIFLYKCFRSKTTEESEKSHCLNEQGEYCLAAGAEMNKPGYQDKVVLRYMNMNLPARPGILIQRQSKTPMAIPLKENISSEEDRRQLSDSENLEGELPKKTIPIHRSHSGGENQKRPLKGVTFSKEVIVVDLGNAYPTPRSYAREHKERK